MSYIKVALVGKPNVGKSTLFNSLTHSNRALVSSEPGMTRDVRSGTAHLGLESITIFDTGGISSEEDIQGISQLSIQAALGADLVLLMVDVAEPLSSEDQAIIHQLRINNIRYWCIGNKVAGVSRMEAIAELSTDIDSSLLYFTDAQSGSGVQKLKQRLHEHLFPHSKDSLKFMEQSSRKAGGIKAPQDSLTSDRVASESRFSVTIVGRTNVGKSTLINTLVGKNIALVSDIAGTTHDDVEWVKEEDGQEVELIDTAGMVRSWHKGTQANILSSKRSLDKLKFASLTLLVLDATSSPSKTDQILLGKAIDRGSACLLVVNKVDLATPEMLKDHKLKRQRFFRFMPHLETIFVSAEQGTGLTQLQEKIQKIHKALMHTYSTPVLCDILYKAVEAKPPPYIQGRRIAPKFVSPLRLNPLVLILQGNNCTSLSLSYMKYLQRNFAQALNIPGQSVKIYLRNQFNPYSSKKDKNTGLDKNKTDSKHKQDNKIG